MTIATVTIYLLLFTALSGALGAILCRNYFHAIFAFIIAGMGVSGILFLLNLPILSAVIFWYLGSSSALILLQSYLLMGKNTKPKPTRQLVFGKFFYALIASYTSVSVGLAAYPALISSHNNPLKPDVALVAFSQSNYAFALIIFCLISPFIFISSLLLLKQNNIER